MISGNGRCHPTYFVTTSHFRGHFFGIGVIGVLVLIDNLRGFGDLSFVLFVCLFVHWYIHSFINLYVFQCPFLVGLMVGTFRKGAIRADNTKYVQEKVKQQANTPREYVCNGYNEWVKYEREKQA